jgi:diguanylate cyclase (GGDEF)-like protein
VQLALFGMLVLLIAWFGGERLIVRPIRALVLTAARFGRGDLHVRAGDEPWLAEFQPLAAALDDMAHKLAAIEDLLITHADSPCGHVTVSVGVESIVPAPGQAAADLVEAADRALYAAKRRGRNTVIAHVPMVMSAA